MTPEEYDQLLEAVRAAKVQHLADMRRAHDSAKVLDEFLMLLSAEDHRIARAALSRIAAAGATLSTAGSD